MKFYILILLAFALSCYNCSNMTSRCNMINISNRIIIGDELLYHCKKYEKLKTDIKSIFRNLTIKSMYYNSYFYYIENEDVDVMKEILEYILFNNHPI